MTEATAPNFLNRLQAADREQGMIQLRTLLTQHQHNLSRLPRLAAELKALLESTESVDLGALAGSMQTALTQANDLLLAVDLAPVDHPDQTELLALGDKLLPLVSAGTVAALSARFAQTRDSVVQAAKAAQAQQAKADAVVAAQKAQQAAAQQALQNRRAAAKALGFIDHGDGTVTDTHHKLMWKQCAEGQSGETCEGEPGKFTWDVAMAIPKTLNLRGGFAGHSDWRLPTKDELASLVMPGRTSPAICTEAFPNTPSSWFWSSTPNDTFAWGVHFGNGDVNLSGRGDNYHVRLVRASQ